MSYGGNKMKIPTKLIAIAAVVLLVGLSAWYMTVSASISGQQINPAPGYRPVPTATAKPDPEKTYRSFPGSVRATGRVEIAFNVDGLLTDLNATEGTQRLLDHAIHRLRPGDVALDEQALLSHALDLGADRARLGLAGAAIDDHRRAPARKQQRRGFADPHARPRHDSDLVFECVRRHGNPFHK